MIPLRDSKYQEIENLDGDVPDVPCASSICINSNGTRIDDNNQPSMTSVLDLDNEFEELLNDVRCSNKMLPLNKPCSGFNDTDYAENIKEFHLYVDMVKEIARPGCSPAILDVVLSSLSSIFKTLSAISSKQYMHASL